MKINNFGYLIKEGIRGIFLHGFMSFAAICVTVACLLIVGSFSSLVYNINIMVEDLNKTNEIMAYIDEDLSYAEAQTIETKIRQIGNVHDANLKSREEALEDFASDYDEYSFEGVDSEIFRHRVVIVLADNSLMDETIREIEGIAGVEDIRADYQLADFFSTLQNVIHVISVVVIAVLLMVSLLIISNTVKLAMYDRRDEISIMKMVGATNGFIRLPFVVEGFTLGMIGAAVAFGVEWMLYNSLLEWLSKEGSILDLITFVPFRELLVPMVITFAAAGLFVGIVGSWTSIRKFMNV